MRNVFIGSLAVLMALGMFAACNSNEHLMTQLPKAPSPTPAPNAPPNVATNPADAARRISAEELHDLYEKGKVLIVDTRNEPSYKQSHIKGAILIPANEFATRSGELPRDKMIVTYCT